MLALLVAMATAVTFPARVDANPTDGTVAAGVVDIHVTPNTVDVNQHSNRAVIDWRGFDIAPGETTEFHQPDASAIALNRVHSSQASVIDGALKANGNVIIVNQNGVLFGRNAQVDVNGLVATTADIDNDRFMNDAHPNFNKPGNPNAAIVNQGQITARESGLVGFVAPTVENDGVISARLGRVHLAAGDKATIDFYGDGLMEVGVSDDVTHQLVKNTGAINADGGVVALTAAAGNRILTSALQVGGSVSSQTVGMKNGRIVIAGLGGNAVAGNVASTKVRTVISTVDVAGNLDASGKAAGQKGGAITVTGDRVHLAATARLDASGALGGGSIKVGGDYHGTGATPSALQLVVDHGASIANDALYIGNGGATVLWSDGATDYSGTITSRGGALGGNGGFVEVSGHDLLGYHGLVDTRANHGLGGTLLLDPATLTISTAANSNVTGATPFDSTGAATSNLNVTTLTTALGTSNVVINTAGGTGGTGDITFANAVSWNSAFSLTANADRHITVNAAITNSGTGGITLNANTAGSIITVAAPISTGGALTLSAAQDILVNAGLTSGGAMTLTATSRDITSNASGVLNATGALGMTAGRDVTFGANATSGNNVTVAAARDITVGAGATVTNGSTSALSLQAAGGSTAGTGNLNLNGTLNVGTGALTLSSGINGTRASWTATNSNLLRQGATFGTINIQGFLNLAINRVLNSANNVTLTGTDTGGNITLGAALSGFNLTLNAANSVTANAAVTATGSTLTLGSTALDVIVGSAGSLTSSGNVTLNGYRDISVAGPVSATGFLSMTSTTRDILLASTGSLSSTNNATLNSARDVTFNGSLNTGGNLAVTAARDITVAAGQTLTNGASSTMNLSAAGGSSSGAGNLNLNGTLNVGTGTLTLISGLNGTRPSWTATTSNLLRQGATFGAISFNGFLNLILNRSINSSGTVNINATNTNGTITVGSGTTLSGAGVTLISSLDTTINGAVTSSTTLGVTSSFTNVVIGSAGSTNSTGNSTFSSLLDTNVNGSVTAGGTLGMTSGQDLLIAASTGSTNSTGATTFTVTRDLKIDGSATSSAALTANVTRDIIMTAPGSINSTNGMTLNGRDITLGNVTGALSGGSTLAANATRDITTLASTTITPGASSNLTLSAAGGSSAGTGNLTLNGILNAGGQTLTLISGINGTRPSWTATTANLLRQGATFGNINIQGFLNLVIARDLNSNGSVSLIGNNTGGNITINSGSTVSGTSVSTTSALATTVNGAINSTGTVGLTANLAGGTITIGSAGSVAGTNILTNSNLDTNINGTITASGTLGMTSAQDLIIGATTGATSSTGATTFTITRDLKINGTVGGASTVTGNVTRDIIMSSTGTVNPTGAVSLNGRDITLGNVSSGSNISATATRDLTTLASTTVQPAAAGNLTLYAAGNVVTGTGNLTLNGVLRPGSGALNLTSGVNGTRPNMTFTTTNLIPQSTFGPVTITGFLDTFINRDIASNSNVSIISFRDLTLGATYTVTPASGGNITMAAANNVVSGTGNFYVNGILNNGTGTTTLLSGVNGTRPNYTMTSSNFLKQGATYPTLSITGFQDITFNTDVTSNGNIVINAYRDLTVGLTNTLTSGAAFGITLTAANNVVTGTGNLVLSGTLKNGTGGLTLTSGVNGTRPNLTMNGVNIQRLGASYGNITINGFLDTTVSDNLISNGSVSITSFRDLTLSAINTITTGTTGALTLLAANNVVTGTGNLAINGNMNIGNGGLTLLSGINGTRPSFTFTAANTVANNTNFGAISVNGFLDTTVSTNMTSLGNIGINSYRDLTVSGGSTLTECGTCSLSLTAANNAVAGTGNLNLTGNIGAGSGGLTLVSGINGTRPNWTATTTNLLQPGANYGVVSITGFQDLTLNRDITGTTAVTMIAQRDLTVAATRTVTTSAAGTLNLQAANGVVAGTGKLTISGNIGSGAGALTLISGINGGTRPTFTANTTTLLIPGGTFGAISIQGFNDFFIDRPITSNNTISFTNNTRNTLSDNVTSTSAGGITFGNPVYIDENTTSTVTSNNGPINFNSTVDDTIGGAADNLVVSAGSGTVTFSGAVNGVGLTVGAGTITTPASIGATRALQNVALTSTNAWSVPSITASKILVRTTGATSDLTIASGRVLTASATGDAIIVAAGRNFINNNGTGALVRTGGGRFITYSTAPGSDTQGGLTYDDRRFSCSFATAGTCAYNATINATVSVPATGNIFLYSSTPVLLIVTPATIADIIYGAAVPNLVNYSRVPFTMASGYLTASDFSTDVITGSINGQTNYTQGSNIGAYNISYLSGALNSSLGYGFSYQTLNNAFNVLPRHVNVDVSGIASKVYDGTTTATLASSNYTINNIYSGDTATLGVSNTSVTYDNKNVGTSKVVTANGLALTGTPAGNYILDNTSDSSSVGTITQRVLTITAASPNRVYDTTTASSATLSDNRVAGDVLSTSYGSATFANKNVGTGKTVTVSGLGVTGTDAGNYSYASSIITTANITQAPLTITATGINKVYDGTTTATFTFGDNRFAGDVLTFGYGSATYGNKNIGTAKAISVSGITLGGTDGGNYSYNTTTSTAADITARALTITASGINKVYDGTTTATFTFGDNRVAGDVLTLGYGSATYGNKNVGTAKAIGVSGITLGGTDSGNYTFNTTTSTSANITARALTVTASGVNKVYDGNATAAITLGDNRVGGDALTISYGTALFPDKNVGTGRTITVSGINVTGTDAGNYTFNTGTTTTANITARALTVTASGINKVYDGTTTATFTFGDNRVVGDVLTLGYGSATYSNKNVGTAKAISVSGITLGGTDSGNYTFNTTASTAADITARALTVTANGINKVYDGTNVATFTFGDNRVAGDVLTLGYGSATYGNKNVGTAKAISVSGITLGGTDAGNYTYNTTASTAADITARALTVTASGINKVYDGNTTATFTFGDNRVAGDVLTLGYGSATYGNKNVGTAKAISVSGITLGGTDSGNYTFNTTASTAADITARALTVTANGINKVYDGTNVATFTFGDNRVAGDVLTLGYGSATYGNKNVGTAKAISVSGITLGGTDSSNYTFNTTASTAANITARALTITASGINKVYDGSNVATFTFGDNRVAGDVLTLGYGSATYGNKNVGTAKAISVSGITLGGTDAGNYTFNTTASTAADITARSLTVTASGINKVYDGSNVATFTFGDNRVAGDVLTLGYGSATYGNKNVGTAKAISVSGITLGGTDAGNYTFNTTASTAADITARALTVTASGINKVYDGNTTATFTFGDNRVAGDVLTLGYGSATYGNKNVSTAKAINVSGITLGGTDAGNYTFNTTASTAADITARALTVTANGINKVYDGSNVATFTFGDNRVAGDVLSLGYGSALFPDKNVGVGRTVTVSGINVTGTDAGNYSFNTGTTATATISKATLTIGATASDKIYDGNAIAAIALNDNRISGDVLTLGYGSALFPDKNVGTNRTVTVSGITLGGTDAANYNFNTGTTATASIAARALTVSATGINKVYDGNATAAVTLGDNRVGGDALTISYGTALFPDKNVGTGRTITVSGINVIGADAGNYTFNTGTTTTADITPKALSVSATGIDKIYDGTNVATVSLGDNRVAGDVLILTYGSALFPDKNVGNSRAVSVSGIGVAGLDSGNYTYNTTAGTTASITPRALTVGASGINRVYNGNAGATVTLNDDRVAGDVLGVTYGSAAFPDKNVGTGRTVTVSGINVTGTDAANYSFNTGTTTTANITPAVLTVSASGSSKIYDGNAVAGVTLSDDRVAGDALILTYGSALFPDKNAGVGRTITVSGINVTGTDAGNYTFNTGATTTATIAKALLTVTAANQNVTYGTAVPATTLGYSGFIGSEDQTFLATQPTASSAASGIVNAGTYTNNYSVAGGVDGNYSFAYVPGTLTVGKKDLNVTADTQSITYGTTVPTGSLIYSGFVSGEDATYLGTAPTVSSGASGLVNVGTYTNNYTVGGGVSNNYDFHYFNADLVVTKKDLNVTANNQSVNYGVAVPAGSISYSGFVTGQDATFLATAPTVSSAASGMVNAGTYTNNYTVGGGVDGNYIFHYAPGTLTVTPIGLNVTVGNRSVTYGTAVPASSITYTGFVNGDDATSLATQPTVSSGVSGIVHAGTYSNNYTAAGGVSSNYVFNYIPGTLIVSQKALNVTAGNRTVTYGTAVPASALNYSGFIAGEDETFLTSQPTLTSAHSGVVNAGIYLGNYGISGGASTDYYFNFTPGNLTVTARTLNVSAVPQTVVYGTAVPAGSILYSGFAPGEDATFLGTQPTVSSVHSGIMNAGTYANNYTVAGGVSGNYAFVYSPADLVVTQRPLSVSAASQTITYGTLVPTTGLIYSGFATGEDATFLATAPTVSSGVSGYQNADTYLNNYTVSGGADSNYSFIYTPGSLTINKAALTISANNVSMVYGSGNSFGGVSPSGLQLGEFIGAVDLTTNAGTSSGGNWNHGSWNIHAANAHGGTFNPANYIISYLDGSLIISKATLSVTPVAAGKVYDGTDLASVTLGDNRASGDVLVIGYGDARFPDKQAGTNRLVTVSGITLGGADAANYNVAGTATTTATITKRVLVISANAASRLYDGTDLASVTLSDNRVAGDLLTIGYGAATFPDAAVGNNRTVTVSGLFLNGADNANYSFAPSATTTASIWSVVPPTPPVTSPPPTVVKVSQDTGSVVTATLDDGIYATPSTSYQLIFLPYDAPNENRWRNKPLRGGIGVPIIDQTAWYGEEPTDDI